jgi:Kef-type K+ transport system membrane component KefB
VGLAPIVGAFAAGLVLDEVSLAPVRAREPEGLEHQVHPIAGFLVPIFFVVTGAHVDLRAFADPTTLGLAAALTAAAIAGKQICGLAVVERGLDRLSIGIGMIPRGEVGLIFAAVGAALVLPDGTAAIDRRTHAAVVVMVFVTTLLTPPVLSWSLRRRASSTSPSS